MTIPEFSPSHGLLPPIPRYEFSSWWPGQCKAAGQFWPSSCAFQRSCGLPQEHNPALFWWSHGHVPTQPGGCHQSAWVEPQTRGCPCLSYRRPHPLPVLLAGGPDSYLICVWTHDVVPGGWLHVRVGHIPFGHVWVRWSPTVVGVTVTVLIPSTPWGSHHSTIIRISGGLSWTGRG